MKLICMNVPMKQGFGKRQLSLMHSWWNSLSAPLSTKLKFKIDGKITTFTQPLLCCQNGIGMAWHACRHKLVSKKWPLYHNFIITKLFLSMKRNVFSGIMCISWSHIFNIWPIDIPHNQKESPNDKVAKNHVEHSVF